MAKIVAAQLDMSGNKVTNLANGSDATDAVAFGQLAGYEPANANIQIHIASTSNPHQTKITNLADGQVDAAPADNELLAWDTTAGKWINQTATEANLPPRSHASSATSYGVSSVVNYGHAIAYNSTPAMDDASGSAGTTTASFAMGNHIHPTDTSRAPTVHSSTTATYGLSSTTNYGHARAAVATTDNPVMDGVVSVGSTPAIFAQSNHVHPSDTSRAASVHTHVSSSITDLPATLFAARSTRVNMFECNDFIGSLNGSWSAIAVNSGTATSAAGTLTSANHQGVILGKQAASTNNSGYCYSTYVAGMRMAVGLSTTYIIYTNTADDQVLNHLRVGFTNSVTITDPTNGAWIKKVDDTLQAHANGWSGSVSASIPAIQNAWLRFVVTVQAVGAGTSAVLYEVYDESGTLLWSANPTTLTLNTTTLTVGTNMTCWNYISVSTVYNLFGIDYAEVSQSTIMVR